MRPENDDDSDAAWRSIVENYGERAELDDPPSAPFGGRFGNLVGGAPDDGAGGAGAGGAAAGTAGAEDEDLDEYDEDAFVPPTPPPLPRVAPDRMVAWVGIFGSPALLLAAMIFSISLPTWLGYLLVAGFVGGFIYLVAKMPRGPRDPWDDGAQV